MKFFKVGDRVRSHKGLGTIIKEHEVSFLIGQFTVQMDDGSTWLMSRWHLEHVGA